MASLEVAPSYSMQPTDWCVALYYPAGQNINTQLVNFLPLQIIYTKRGASYVGYAGWRSHDFTCIISLRHQCERLRLVSSGLHGKVAAEHEITSLETQVKPRTSSSRKINHVETCARICVLLNWCHCERTHYCAIRCNFTLAANVVVLSLFKKPFVSRQWR